MARGGEHRLAFYYVYNCQPPQATINVALSSSLRRGSALSYLEPGQQASRRIRDRQSSSTQQWASPSEEQAAILFTGRVAQPRHQRTHTTLLLESYRPIQHMRGQVGIDQGASRVDETCLFLQSGMIASLTRWIWGFSPAHGLRPQDALESDVHIQDFLP